MTGYVRPRQLDEALSARRTHPDWVVLCGGTDLLVASATRPDPPGVIDLFGLDALRGVAEKPDGGIRIGAATTYADILRSPVCARALPALGAAAREIGALQIQARGTIGGNVATSSPVGDTLPVLLALDAAVEVASTEGARVIPYEAFCTGYRETALRADELIVAIHVPRGAPGLVQHWRKVGTRRAQSISKVMIAAAARVDGGRVAYVRIALGAVADRPIRARAAEAAVLGRAPGPGLAEAAAQAVAGEIRPIDDVRSSARYRLRVAQNLTARFVLRLARPAAGSYADPDTTRTEPA